MKHRGLTPEFLQVPLPCCDLFTRVLHWRLTSIRDTAHCHSLVINTHHSQRICPPGLNVARLCSPQVKISMECLIDFVWFFFFFFCIKIIMIGTIWTLRNCSQATLKFEASWIVNILISGSFQELWVLVILKMMCNQTSSCYKEMEVMTCSCCFLI